MNTLVAFVDAGDDKVDYEFACHPDVLVEQVGGVPVLAFGVSIPG